MVGSRWNYFLPRRDNFCHLNSPLVERQTNSCRPVSPSVYDSFFLRDCFLVFLKNFAQRFSTSNGKKWQNQIFEENSRSLSDGWKWAKMDIKMDLSVFVQNFDFRFFSFFTWRYMSTQKHCMLVFCHKRFISQIGAIRAKVSAKIVFLSFFENRLIRFFWLFT